MGRPIITTDVPGCRETVINGENGFLAIVRDSASAAAEMMKLLDREDRQIMGRKSRELCERRYDVHKVNKAILLGLKIS